MKYTDMVKEEIEEYNYLVGKYSTLNRVYLEDSNLLSILINTIGEEKFNKIISNINQYGTLETLRKSSSN